MDELNLGTLENKTILNSFLKAREIFSSHSRPAIAISGGADSDIVLDICAKTTHGEPHYVWYNTGLEYEATKNHIKFLENKYAIKIEVLFNKICHIFIQAKLRNKYPF